MNKTLLLFICLFSLFLKSSDSSQPNSNSLRKYSRSLSESPAPITNDPLMFDSILLFAENSNIAARYLKELLTLKYNSKDLKEIAVLNSEIAEMFFEIGQYNNAIKYFELAINQTDDIEIKKDSEKRLTSILQEFWLAAINFYDLKLNYESKRFFNFIANQNFDLTLRKKAIENLAVILNELQKYPINEYKLEQEDFEKRNEASLSSLESRITPSEKSETETENHLSFSHIDSELEEIAQQCLTIEEK